MEASLGRITARLAEKDEAISSDLIDRINHNINPPIPVGADDVHIRTMFIVSDQVNSFGGRFPFEEHQRLVDLLVDSPVMVGHRKDRLPVGRNFHAVTIEKDGQHWVKSYFYWLKNAEGAENLKENIDGGIYKECSIGFTFLFPECSVCGRDIRSCEHEPLQKYKQGDQDVECHFNYRQIERVLETSLVYRGALPDTEISRELKMDKIKLTEAKEKVPAVDFIPLTDPDELDKDGQYLIVPYYEALPVQLTLQVTDLKLERTNGVSLGKKITDNFLVKQSFKNFDNLNVEHAFGRLVGYRGKERCPVKQLEKYLSDGTGPVNRLVLMLFPNEKLEYLESNGHKPQYDIRPIPYRYARQQEIITHAVEITTRAGVEIWPLENGVLSGRGYHYNPGHRLNAPIMRYTLAGNVNSSDVRLVFEYNMSKEKYIVRQFNLERLTHGGRFILDKGDDKETVVSSQSFRHQGGINNLRRENEGFFVMLTGILEGEYIIRPIKLDGRERFLIYRSNDN